MGGVHKSVQGPVRSAVSSRRRATAAAVLAAASAISFGAVPAGGSGIAEAESKAIDRSRTVYNVPGHLQVWSACA
ncbi:hypothetical protein JK358_18000 [Nocardia sp. 2]|uniref:Uncharacterized protein n=1 Tax=Nocardia acididurans TaxID=2802282 RepID=A0ABS1M6Q0_9NOCA|nr:hypothetical protein [Nocardia acididurans]MBL1076295.1 hypothetical protein [Nocardia acididurans]